jgi:hypothetical protein
VPLEQPASEGKGDLCPPLAPATGSTITVATVAALVDVVNSAASGTTILVADGTYALDGAYLRFATPNVTLRAASGDRARVVLDGDYVTTEIIQIVASNITIADVTLREAYNHPIHVMSSASSDTTGTLIYNVHIVDPGQQAIKINPNPGQNADYFPDDGIVACSHIELTSAGREKVLEINEPLGLGCYTGGVDAHQARDWVIRDNLIEGFWCVRHLSEHGIHLWRACRDTLVARNTLRDNARGIGFGLVTDGDGVRTYPDNPCPGAGGSYVDHYGGIIRNNFVFASDTDLFTSASGFDCGICLANACGAWVVHNTVAATQAPFSSIEWRFDNTDADIVNNLVSHSLRNRDGTARLSGNLEGQPLSLFVDGGNGDLHLAEGATVAIDQGVAVAAGLCDDDIDGDARPVGAAPDVGADEVGTSVPLVTSLRLAAPVGGEMWPISSTRHIRWTATQGVTQVGLLYSTDGFMNEHVITSLLMYDAGSLGVYTWTTPVTTTYTAQVRVMSLISPTTVSDTSGLFTLYDPATLTATLHLPLVMSLYDGP